MKRLTSKLILASSLLLPVLAFAQAKPLAGPIYPGWKQAGALALITTPEGANLPAGAVLEGFPILVRLDKNWFDFSKAKPNGDDIRFATAAGAPLSYQIEEWDAAKGTASIWVRVPKIEGNARQMLRVYWGKADATSESSGRGVFNEANGYLSVWHMSDPVKDEVGTVESKDMGTSAAVGPVGTARHFAGKQGINCGENITNFPSAASPHSTEVWYRSDAVGMDLICWGKEGTPAGKVRMQLQSPPHIYIDSDGGSIHAEGTPPKSEWVHVVHTYDGQIGQVYVNGKLDVTAPTRTTMKILNPVRLWLGGWYNNYNFVGDMDEVRISKVARSADWVKLQYENQKQLQTAVGPVVQPGAAFAVTPAAAVVAEGKTATFTAQAGGALKMYWTVKSEGKETLMAVDQFAFTFNAGRVVGDKTVTLQYKAVYPTEVKTKEIAISVKEGIPDPVFTLAAPPAWDGRTTIEVVPRLANLGTMQAAGAGELKTEWSVTPFAVIKEIAPGKLLLKRAQNSGKLTVTATISNGGKEITQSTTITVTEPKTDPWVARVPAKDEKPEDGQFYARDEKGEGTLYYNGTLSAAADAVFIKVSADDKPYKIETAKPAADKSYALAVKLKPGLVKYKVEFGTKVGGKETVEQTVSNIVCGDAYIIEGQSNALSTDTHDKSPADTNEWIRSYGRAPLTPKDATGNLWCNPVWKAEQGEKAELGWWGMELAKRLLESQKVPIFIINGAVGGTRVDQHLRSATDPTDLTTIYGRLLWRVQQAKMTHGIRAILWHQGESDQGADGPSGLYGWQTYQQLFMDVAAGWKQDFPNVKHYYVFQIWPNACSMGRSGSGDMLREKLRTLPQCFSNMSIMSTLGIRPPGGCHYPLTGWSEITRLIQPLIERDYYGKVPATSITPANLKHASYAAGSKDKITLEFDQPVVWEDKLASQFYLDDEKDKVASGSVSGNVLTLKLKEASTATQITYLKEASWSQDNLLNGANGIAALTFCKVPLAPTAH